MPNLTDLIRVYYMQNKLLLFTIITVLVVVSSHCYYSYVLMSKHLIKTTHVLTEHCFSVYEVYPESKYR